MQLLPLVQTDHNVDNLITITHISFDAVIDEAIKQIWPDLESEIRTMGTRFIMTLNQTINKTCKMYYETSC